MEGEVQDPSTATNILTSYQLQSLLVIEYPPSTQITACRDPLPQPKNPAAGVTPTTYTLKADLLDEAGAARFFHPGQNVHYLDYDADYKTRIDNNEDILLAIQMSIEATGSDYQASHYSLLHQQDLNNLCRYQNRCSQPFLSRHKPLQTGYELCDLSSSPKTCPDPEVAGQSIECVEAERVAN